MHENAKSGMSTNPMIRTDHPNPRDVLLSILERAIGSTTPPIDDPETTSPNAAALFFIKYCVTAAIDGDWTMPIAMPISTPCASINCQYLSQRLVIMMANT